MPPKRFNTLDEAFEAQITKAEGCWLWTGATAGKGYGALSAEGVLRYAHRFSFEKFRGPIPAGLHVLHRCDNPPCCNPDHLFIGTRTDNMHDASVKGRLRNRERNPQAKLTEAAVAEIRERYLRGGISRRALGEEYGVNEATIGKAVRGKTWGAYAGVEGHAAVSRSNKRLFIGARWK